MRRTKYDSTDAALIAEQARSRKRLRRAVLVAKAAATLSGAQCASFKRIAKSAARPGELISFHRGPDVYHVGVYVGAAR